MTLQNVANLYPNTEKMSKNMYLLSFKVKWLLFRCAPKRAVRKSSIPTSAAKSICSFLLFVKETASVFEYPQDVHTREAKIYSPKESMNSN